MKTYSFQFILLSLLFSFGDQIMAQVTDSELKERFIKMSVDKENEAHRQHIHSVVHTPNGNDYGKDLLRQHYEEHPHK